MTGVPDTVDIEQVKRHYAQPGRLATRQQTHARYSLHTDDLAARCAEAMRLDGGESILDAGCGNGEQLRYFKSDGHCGLLAGCDLSEGMLRDAAKTLVTAPHVALIRANVEALPFASATFDWVIARHMLYHVADLHRALAEMARVGGTQGKLLAVANAQHFLPHCRELLNRCLAAFGLPPSTGATSGFTNGFNADTGATYLAVYFGQIHTIQIVNALVFREPQPVVDYVETLLPEIDTTTSLVGDSMRSWLLNEAQVIIDLAGGELHDPKPLSLFVCAEPLH